MKLELELNGEPVTADVDPTLPLRDVLREEFGLTGVKNGCLSGRCGVCTVHIDGAAVKSCLLLAGKANGASVRTIEGVSQDGELHDVQQAFDDNFAVQCGYCTPGFIMSALEYVENDPTADRDDVKAAIKGNVCRCTGYEKIVDAVADVALDRVSPQSVADGGCCLDDSGVTECHVGTAHDVDPSDGDAVDSTDGDD